MIPDIADDKGLYHCHVCHSGGDKFRFIQEYLKTDFKGALRWFGLEPGKPPNPDPAIVGRNAAIDKVREWVRSTGRRLRDEYYGREVIRSWADEYLAEDPEDETGWELLRIALVGETYHEYLLDEIDQCRNDDERPRAWREYHNAV